MGIYIGVIEKKPLYDNEFINFKPIAEIRGDQISFLLSEDLARILPDSERRNVNLEYNWHDENESARMRECFSESTPIVFEFILEDLKENYKPNGERNPTGYKVSAMQMLDSKKIRKLGDAKVYFALQKDEILSDFRNDALVQINYPNISEGDDVLVEMDNYWVGPFTVQRFDYNDAYCIKPMIKENLYTVRGISSDQVRKISLRCQESYNSEKKWLVLFPKSGAAVEQIDVIPETVLLEEFFKECIKNEALCNGSIRFDDIPSLLAQYNKSNLGGPFLTEETRTARLQKLIGVLSSEEDMDKTLRTVADSICDLLVKYQDSDKVSDWLDVLIKKNPDLLDRMQSSKSILQRQNDLKLDVDSLKDQCTELMQQRDDLKKEIAETQNRAASVDQQAIEEKKKALLDQEAEYKKLLSAIEESRKLYNLIEDYDALQQRHANLKKDVEDLANRRSYLDRETTDLKSKFTNLINGAHNDMVKLAFDGFVSSKMIQAAAQWEAEQNESQHVNLASQIDSIATSTKTPEELIDYLCRNVQRCRPTYSRNTILNIAICMTQSFLTVFSGDPGCGKTSICNLFGDVLGLNKISTLIDCPEESRQNADRYISVSVERGWTSKRDFVGYYNPLSKVFDRSNSRVYDALSLLHTEKRTGKAKLPFVILLDEANLSPMEYYWSDFMNICDDLRPNSIVNLGEDYIFSIPETLHFVATINNDHTTETLSPRLIDRSWVITLPRLTQREFGNISLEHSIPEDQVEVISWKSLRNAFIPSEKLPVFSREIQKAYESIVAKMLEKRFAISPRVDIAIRRYWSVASKYFEANNTQTEPAVIALDYAVSQRLLPKISGSGEEFENWLKDLSSVCSSYGLSITSYMIKEMLDRGNQQMKYYQFFS